MYCNPQDKILEFIQLELNNSYKNPSSRTERASEGQTLLYYLQNGTSETLLSDAQLSGSKCDTLSIT